MRKIWLLVPAFAICLVILFPSHNLWMGDGYNWVDYFEESDFTRMSLNKGGGMYLYFFPMVLYEIAGFAMSYVFGAVYFLYAFLLANRNKKYLVLFVLPIIQLFAGYVEIYAAVYAMSVATYYYYITENDTLFPVFGVLTFLCHIVIGLPIVAFVITVWIKKRQYLAATLSTLAVVCYILYINAAFQRESPFFSLTGYYSVFSATHLLELSLLFAFLFLWIPLNWRKGKDHGRWEMLVPIGLALGLTIVTIPHIGMFRDWDLMAMSLLPVTFWYVRRINRVRVHALLFCMVLTSSFIGFNFSDPGDYMLKYMLRAPQYSPEFFDGHQLVKTLTVYANKTDDRRAERLLFETRTSGYNLDTLYHKWKRAGLLNSD